MDLTTYTKDVSDDIYTYTLTAGGLTYVIHLSPYSEMVNITIERPYNP